MAILESVRYTYIPYYPLPITQNLVPHATENRYIFLILFSRMQLFRCSLGKLITSYVVLEATPTVRSYLSQILSEMLQ